MKKLLVVVLLAGMLLSGCETISGLSPKTKTGAGIGAVAGGILGALVDSNKPWRGAIIGAAAGAAAGGWIGYKMDNKDAVVEADSDIVAQAATEAAKQNATIKYSRVTEDGVAEDIIATPGNLTGNIRAVTVDYFRNNTLISTEHVDVEV
ncbi:MAG: glycine zipper 2TM domain-containing protein [Candidatus Omnitrophica bacterium]|nr:glycine zipper 2TM domain-containing protein [Candidatus Omnitrophota bacterium]